MGPYKIRKRDRVYKHTVYRNLSIQLHCIASDFSDLGLHNSPRPRRAIDKDTRDIRNECLLRLYALCYRKPGECEQMMEMRFLLNQDDCKTVT